MTAAVVLDTVFNTTDWDEPRSQSSVARISMQNSRIHTRTANLGPTTHHHHHPHRHRRRHQSEPERNCFRIDSITALALFHVLFYIYSELKITLVTIDRAQCIFLFAQFFVAPSIIFFYPRPAIVALDPLYRLTNSLDVSLLKSSIPLHCTRCTRFNTYPHTYRVHQI